MSPPHDEVGIVETDVEPLPGGFRDGEEVIRDGMLHVAAVARGLEPTTLDPDAQCRRIGQTIRNGATAALSCSTRSSGSKANTRSTGIMRRCSAPTVRPRSGPP